MSELNADYRTVFIVFGLAYFLGSIPTGLLISKLFGLKDPREIGSGNVGATNVMRSGNKLAGALTFLGDMAKGFLVIKIALYYIPELMPVAAFIVVVGHVFPVWLGFDGGKGVATTVGVLFGIHYSIGLIYVIVWAMTFWVFHVSAVSAIVATAVIPLFTYMQLGLESALLMLCLSILVITRHGDNIVRLMRGKEYVFGVEPKIRH